MVLQLQLATSFTCLSCRNFSNACGVPIRPLAAVAFLCRLGPPSSEHVSLDMWHLQVCHKVQCGQRWGFDFKVKSSSFMCWVLLRCWELGLIYCDKRTTTLRMLNVVLRTWSVFSAFVLFYDSSEISATMSRKNLVFWAVAFTWCLLFCLRDRIRWEHPSWLSWCDIFSDKHSLLAQTSAVHPLYSTFF